MKQVVPDESQKKTVVLSNVSRDKFYGIERKGGEKGFISEYGICKYRWFVASQIHRGVFWGFADSRFLETTVEIAMKNGKVFEFDTAKELFTWLAS